MDEIPKGYVHPDVTDIEVKDTAEVQKFEVLVEPICIRITGYALSSAAEKKQTRTIRSGIYVHIRDLFEERSLELPEAYTRVPVWQLSGENRPKNGWLCTSGTDEDHGKRRYVRNTGF